MLDISKIMDIAKGMGFTKVDGCILAILLALSVYVFASNRRLPLSQYRAKRAMKKLIASDDLGHASASLLVAAILRVQYGDEFAPHEKTADTVHTLLKTLVKEKVPTEQLSGAEKVFSITEKREPWGRPFQAFLAAFPSGYEKETAAAIFHAVYWTLWYGRDVTTITNWLKWEIEAPYVLSKTQEILDMACAYPVATRCYNGKTVIFYK